MTTTLEHVEEGEKGRELATAPCRVFPDGVHAWQIVSSNNDKYMSICFARTCPCGAFVPSPRFDRVKFEAGGLFPELVVVEGPPGDLQ